jgi:transcriptional regulator with XRE-family HTH domain
MTIRERHGDRANRLTTRALLSIGEELREARLQAGLTIRALATSTGISPAQISRIEHGALRHVAYETIVALAAALGMDVPLRAYPSGEPVRDAAQLALLARFRARLPTELRHRSEVPLGIPGDRRAWDEVILGPGWSLPVEAETRLRDVQALHRRFALKCRDGGTERAILLVADTRHNRHVLRLASAEFGAAFPVPGNVALAALDRREMPPGSAVILL